MPQSNVFAVFPFGPPPVLPELGKQFEAYLMKPENLPLYNSLSDIKIIKREIVLDSLFHVELSSPITKLKFNRDCVTEKISDYEEIFIHKPRYKSQDMTFTRPPGKITDNIRGSATNFPFWPGGLDLPTHTDTFDDFDVNFDSDFLEIVPGLTRVFDLKVRDGKTGKMESSVCETPDTIDLRNMMENYGEWIPSLEDQTKNLSTDILKTESELESITIPQKVNLRVLKISQTFKNRITKTEFAELLDSTKPVLDFKTKIPDPAVKYIFNLDAFQKMAILKLENHEHVFVAAHTSAGKTVVAEYAIGLSQKHCTKTIYTSPIKALSNQKYRDFKNKFEDVGLITGDYRMNTQASCLVMTTEILRSMLYGGSEVIRDVEFVIFDEVHYINDSERGHVWEEIVIMLPSTVCIVMLSATVPNVLEFADWVGRTKRSKMYVVSTSKRPVPLQHYLYTGQDRQGDYMFLIQNAEGPFIAEGYIRAEASLEKIKMKAENNKTKGPKKLAPLKSGGEKSYWISFAKYLKKYDRLPVVAFTLSRAKCDRNADMLKDIDLTTEEEKNYINYFFKESIRTLREVDRTLPQILVMQYLLLRGIAKHHSGILPILKEIVEILFQKGLVKFLFATETFAMGVNMPAKSVAFDSIKKYDGTETRVLQPAEYIQMAGRAGRRGQDDTGTVIILCKQVLEDKANLQNMMTGPPTKLESQFRMTYSMILNLMRVKSLRVEEIMSHSFKEFHSRCKLKSYEKELHTMEEDDEYDQTMIPFYEEIEQFYKTCVEFIDLWKQHCVLILGNAKVQKELFPGRFVVITCKKLVNKLAVLLKINSKRNIMEYKVLVIGELQEDASAPENEYYYRMLGFSGYDIFDAESKPRDMMITVTNNDIVAVTKYHTKADFDVVIKDCDQRQLPRFQDNPPSQTCARVITELMEYSRRIQEDGGLGGSHFIRWNELKNNNINVNECLRTLADHRHKLAYYSGPDDSWHFNTNKDSSDADYNVCLSKRIPDFESHFKRVFMIKEKEARKNQLKFLLSHESLQLYPDYLNKVQVLRQLEYINNEDIVEMKGKVACEMGSHELIITELIFQNSLSKFDPFEIAALLSCLVFQVRVDSELEFELTERLYEGIETVKSVHETITALEKDFQYDSVCLNFGLVRGVYDWALGKPFGQIMDLYAEKTQEGIIVRCIQQLNEILCDIKDAAKLFGDLVLKKKMEEASEAIKRDIVFAASLYTQ